MVMGERLKDNAVSELGYQREVFSVGLWGEEILGLEIVLGSSVDVGGEDEALAGLS
jgi:hypothetical protein